jgi:hypothetical protein
VIERSDTEEVDAIPVLASEGARPGEIMVLRSAPIAQATAAAAGGFLAGAAVLGLVHRRKSRRLALAPSRPPRRIPRRSKAVGGALEVVASRSLLVDVHLLGVPGRER